VLRKIFWPRREEVTGKWKKLYSEYLHDLYSSPNIIQESKSRRMRRAGCVIYQEEDKYQFLVGET
jgi:hypothetical protein